MIWSAVLVAVVGGARIVVTIRVLSRVVIAGRGPVPLQRGGPRACRLTAWRGRGLGWGSRAPGAARVWGRRRRLRVGAPWTGNGLGGRGRGLWCGPCRRGGAA